MHIAQNVPSFWTERCLSLCFITGVAFKFALLKIRIIKFKNIVCFCCCKGSGVNGCELSTVYFKQIRSCGCQVAIVAFMDLYYFFIDFLI